MIALVRLCLMALVFPVMASETSPPANIAYQDLLSLPSKKANFSLTYGAHPSQFISVWKAVAMPTKGAASSAHVKSAADLHGNKANHSQKAVVYIHGGCWLDAYDYTHGNGLYLALAEQGIDTYVIEYRRVGELGGGWPGSLQDVKQALTRLNTYWQQHNSPTQVSLVGHSAGGHLALLAAQDSTAMTNIDKVVGLAAITDVTAYAAGDNSCQTATLRFMGGMPKDIRHAYQDATPRAANAVNTLNITLLQGDTDAIVPVSQAASYDGAIIIVNGGGHFDWLHPQTPSFAVFLNQIFTD